MGSVFRAAREQQHLSQSEVAAMTAEFPNSLSRTMISFIENGRSLPGLESLVTLSTVLHIDPGEVIELVQMNLGPRPDHAGVGEAELKAKARELFWSGDYRACLGILDVQLQRLQGPDRGSKADQHAQARIEINRSTVLRRCGALKAAQASAERAISLSEGNRALQAEGYIGLSAILVDKGALPLARDAAARAVSQARAASSAVRGQAYNQRGDVLFASGMFAKARAAFEQARDHARDAGDQHHLIKTEGNLGACLMVLGEPDRGIQQFQRAVKLARKFNDPQAESRWTVELAWQAYERGQLDEADRLAAAALRIAKPRDLALTIFRAEWLRHLIVVQQRPRSADRHRLAYLRRLLSRLRDHAGIPEVKEFLDLIAEERV